MCVSALIVLGDKIRHKIDEQTQENWLMSYIGTCVTCCLFVVVVVCVSVCVCRNLELQCSDDISCAYA